MSGPLHRYTYADYVALEMISTGKHEFLDGEIYAMAGGSEEHSALAAVMVHGLGNASAIVPAASTPRTCGSMSNRLALRRTPIAR
ncbi:MAG: hypothetical protein QOC81_1084 [Thermoanaerobaculia bacterium]|jgi:hypothetical protein|nr:hypothetical protein [Thermoanaerobaculia bacterium]